VARALAKSPAERFPSCCDFVKALGTSPSPTPGARSGSRSRTIRRSPASVLLAEDNAFFRTYVQSTLEGWGFKVVTVPDGNTAWEVLQTPHAPRLVILDWQMPGMDGVEVCRRLRARENSEATYVILLTGRGGTANKVTGLQEGADEYITKPFSPEELRARLQVGCRIVGVRPPPA